MAHWIAVRWVRCPERKRILELSGSEGLASVCCWPGIVDGGRTFAILPDQKEAVFSGTGQALALVHQDRQERWDRAFNLCSGHLFRNPVYPFLRMASVHSRHISLSHPFPSVILNQVRRAETSAYGKAW